MLKTHKDCRRTATWNLFVSYNKYTEKTPFYLKFRHFDRHENSTDVISCLHEMKRTDWLLCLVANSKLKKLESNAVVIYASVLL